MYCYDNSTDDYYTGASGKALQDEGFGIYDSNTNCPTTSRNIQIDSSNDVSYDSPRPSNWNLSSVCISSGCNMANYTWIPSASICHYTIFQTSYLMQKKKCALYIFVYDEDHERYSPLKILSLKG